MINLESIKKSRGFTYVFNEEPTIDAEYVKRLRQKLKMSQSMFAILMHVQKKTVEKWEQGKNPVTNGNAVAMVLFDQNPSLVEIFIVTHGETNLASVENEETHVLKESVFANNQNDVFNGWQSSVPNSNTSWRVQPKLSYFRK